MLVSHNESSYTLLNMSNLNIYGYFRCFTYHHHVSRGMFFTSYNLKDYRLSSRPMAGRFSQHFSRLILFISFIFRCAVFHIHVHLVF